MTEKYKILAKYIKDLSSETPDVETYLFVKDQIAPYKYPRSIVFVDELPKTQTGKLQRFRLREQEGRWFLRNTAIALGL